MSGTIGVKLDRMNALLTQILERLPGAIEHEPAGINTELHKIPEEVLQFPKRRGWPKGKPRKVSG